MSNETKHVYKIITSHGNFSNLNKPHDPTAVLRQRPDRGRIFLKVGTVCVHTKSDPLK